MWLVTATDQQKKNSGYPGIRNVKTWLSNAGLKQQQVQMDLQKDLE